MDRTFTFLFSPFEGVGCFHASIGIAQRLLQRGHRVVFTTPNTWRGKLTPLGFEEEYMPVASQEASENWGDIVADFAPALTLPSIDLMQTFNLAIHEKFVKLVKGTDAVLREIVTKIKPDVIVADQVLQIPALMDQAPLGYYTSEDLPPAFSGYSVIHRDKSLWRNYDDKYLQQHQNLFDDFQSWVLEKGGPLLKCKNSTPFWHVSSPYANMFMFPQEMSYGSHRSEKLNWFQFDNFMREIKGDFEIPSKLEHLPGKLIYFSLGSIGTSELGLMRKMIKIFANSPHRFIVSKGPYGDQLKLAENMWGENFLKQTLILPKVDLVITHGGNNSTTESFYFGKPLIVLPLFYDQLDNAVRVEETGHGLYFKPYHVTEEELLNGIETVAKDVMLKNRMEFIGMRIRARNNQSQAADLIESVAKNHAC